MKKFLALLFLLALLYLTILLAPLGISFHSLHSLTDSGDVIPQEFDGLFIEEAGTTLEEETPQNQAVTLTIHEADLGPLLAETLSKRSYACVKLSAVETAIAPEMISLTLSWRCKLFDYQLYEFTVFSEWWVRLREDAHNNRIEVKPRDIRSKQRYNIFNVLFNWAKVWPYATRTRDADGWLTIFSSSSRVNIRDILLKDQECSISLGF